MKPNIRLIFTLMLCLTLLNCQKEEECISNEIGRTIKLKILDNNGQNVTQDYEIDSIMITGQCDTPGQSPAYGYPRNHVDSLMEFQLGYCCNLDSSKYYIHLNDWQNIKDSFIVYLGNLNKCNSCSIIDTRTYSQQNQFEDVNSTIRLSIYE